MGQSLQGSLLQRLGASLVEDPAREVPDDWKSWLRKLFPDHVNYFAPHHARFWDWVWAIERGVVPSPMAMVAIWARGGAKSTSAELATVAAASRKKRGYGLYVRATQDQADKSVQNIAGLLESPVFGDCYPEFARKNIGRFGNSKAWRRNRLWTAGGFVIDAYGLDVALRGTKVEEQRPDLIVIDDADEQHDSIKATLKKIEVITQGILPAGSNDLAVICIQNLMISNGFFARMVNGEADYLLDRTLIGPIRL